MAAVSSCAMTIPTFSARAPSSRTPSRSISPGLASARTSRSASRTASPSTTPRPSACAPPGGSIPATRPRTSSTAAASARPRAGCRRSMTARRCGSPRSERADLEAQGRRPHWRFLLEHRSVRWDDLVRGPAMSRARRSPIRCSCARTAPTLHAALGGGRHRPRRHPCHPRRGPRHQHGRADPDLRGAGRRGPPLFGHHNLLTDGERRGACRSGSGTSRSVRCASAAWSRWPSPRWRCWSARRRPSGRSPPRRTARGSWTSPACRGPRRVSTRRNSRRSTPGSLHGLPYAAVRGPARRAGIDGADAEPFWLAVRGNLAQCSTDARSGGGVVEGPIAPRHRGRGLARRGRPAAAAGALGRTRPGANGPRRSQGDRPQGQGALHAAAARAHGRTTAPS